MPNRVPAEVFAPGELIREELEARGWTQVDLAEILGRPVRLVNELVAGKKQITPDTAKGLRVVCRRLPTPVVTCGFTLAGLAVAPRRFPSFLDLA